MGEVNKKIPHRITYSDAYLNHFAIKNIMPNQLLKGGNMENMEKTEYKEAKPKEGNNNTVFVGKKGTMGYVLAVVTQFNNGATEVNVKARGKLISRAVDVVEIVRHRFMPNSKVKNIHISTEELTSEDGSMNKVSAIEIHLQK